MQQAAQHSVSYADVVDAMERAAFDRAEDCLDQLLLRNAQDAQALRLMAELYLKRNMPQEAARYFSAAILANPSDLDLKLRFLKSCGGLKLTRRDNEVEAALYACLQTEEIQSIATAAPLWFSILKLRPGFNDLFVKVTTPSFFNRGPKKIHEKADIRPIQDPYFMLGIQKTVLCWLQFEEFIAAIRSYLLMRFDPMAQTNTPNLLATMRAVAAYCFRSDYILDVDEQDALKLKALRTYIENEDPSHLTPQHIAMIACYVPLRDIPAIRDAESRFADHPIIGGLLLEQLRNYKILHAQVADQASVAVVANVVSAQVRAQYEQFPYPCWTSIDEVSIHFQDKETSILQQKDVKVLMAGCGTGMETCLLARAFPNARILAIDLTQASLAYATHMARALGLQNITFQQMDILSLSDSPLRGTFDYVHSFGVLHHMQDPEHALNIVAGMATKTGLLHIGLYSRLARRSITAARQIVAERGYQATAEDMRRFRKDSPRLLKKADFVALSNWYDYYFLNMYRDLIFHAHEDCFDIPRLKNALAHCQLRFGGFKISANMRQDYIAAFPNDPEACDLDNWAVFEQKHPDCFAACYDFVCYHKLATA